MSKEQTNAKRFMRSSSSALGRPGDCSFSDSPYDHKGPLPPSSSDFEHYHVVVDSFSRFIQVFPVKSTSALHTIEAMENWILTSGIPQILVYDRGSAFLNIEVTNWATELRITLAPQTDHSPWANGKVEIQNKHSILSSLFVKNWIRLGVIGTKICFCT